MDTIDLDYIRDVRGFASGSCDVWPEQLSGNFGTMRPRLVASWECLEDDVPHVSVAGEIDISTAPQLDEVLCEARTQDPFSLILSLAECAYCDSIGLSVILRHARHTPHLIVVSPEGSDIRRLLRVSRVDELVQVVSSLEAARAFLQAA